MTVEDAATFFEAVPSISPKLQTLLNVGLGYVRLGQSSTTLSGGTTGIKLSLKLSKEILAKRFIYLMNLLQDCISTI